MKKVHILIILAVVSGIFAVSGFVLAENKNAGVLKRAILSVDNLSCGGCFSTISQNLTPIEGFSGFGANLFRKLIAVDFIPPLTAEAIAKNITEQGYPATIDSIDDITEKESFAVVNAKRNFYSGGGSCCAAPQADQ